MTTGDDPDGHQTIDPDSPTNERTSEMEMFTYPFPSE